MNRDTLARCLAAQLGVILPATAADLPWFTRHLTSMEVGPTGVRFDGREIVQRCVAAHSEYLVLWVRDGDYAYYDSKLLPKAPGLGARDPLREAMDEARQHKLPIITYCVPHEWRKEGAVSTP